LQYLFPVENLNPLTGSGMVLLHPFMLFNVCILDLMPIGMVLCMLGFWTLFLMSEFVARLCLFPFVGGSALCDLAVLTQE
jgi:hypothetical protein